MIEPLLMTASSIETYQQGTKLTNASGLFFERDKRLFLVTAGHVVLDRSSRHFPDGLDILLHTREDNLAEAVPFSIPLYRNKKSIWRQASDSAGSVDVAAIEINRSALPETAVFRSFTPQHLLDPDEEVEVGSTLLVVGFPLGFHDHLHHLPVARQAGLASSFGLRFQGQGYFLTDARTHRGISGAPVVRRADNATENALGDLPWRLLGIHSARLDMTGRDLELDEALGLNCAWYADILYTLTEN